MAAVLQALSTMLLVLLTYLYVKETRRLALAPFHAHLIPELGSLESGEWTFRIRNSGPGEADDISVYALTRTRERQVIKVSAEGPAHLDAGATGEYFFFGLRCDIALRLSFVDTAGKKYSHWVFQQTVNRTVRIPVSSLGWFFRVMRAGLSRS